METGEHITSETAKEMDESKELVNLKKVEAALFLSARFLSLQELVMLTDINPLIIKDVIEKLSEKYNSDESAIEIVNKDNLWKMDVRQEHVHMINKLATGNSEFNKAEQETLAVIAYKQPVKQSVIIKIRGNKAYEHVKKFIETGLVIGKKIGHTKELKLSDNFFEYFHLQKKEGGGIEIEENEDEGGDEKSLDNESEEINNNNEGVSGGRESKDESLRDNEEEDEAEKKEEPEAPVGVPSEEGKEDVIGET